MGVVTDTGIDTNDQIQEQKRDGQRLWASRIVRMFDCDHLRISLAGLTCRLQTYLNSIGYIPIVPPTAT